MKVTLKDILWIGDSNHFTPAQAQNFYGQPRRHVRVVYHHPGVRVTNAESWVRNTLIRQQESYHFVVEGRKLIQTVSMNNVSFSAATASKQWNTDSIHVCVIPEKVDYEFLGALHKFIETYYGQIPGVGHGSLMPTQCPGNVNVKRIMDYARGRIEVKLDGKTIKQWKALADSRAKAVTTRDAEITKLKAEVTKLEKQLDNVLDQDNQTINQLKDKLHVKAGEIETLQDENTDLREACDEKSKDIKRLESKIEPKTVWHHLNAIIDIIRRK